MSDSNLRKKILEADDTQYESVYVPEWDVEVLVTSLSAKRRNILMARSVDTKTREINLDKVYSLLFVNAALDPETKERVFTEKDLDALNEKNGAAVERVAKVAARLSGMNEDEADEMGKDSSQNTPTLTANEGLPSTWPESSSS